jgi:PAS domain S-box-containing protein
VTPQPSLEKLHRTSSKFVPFDMAKNESVSTLAPARPSPDAADALSGGASLAASAGRFSPDACSHSVQFYEDDAIFLNGLSRFLGGALGTGGACVVIATDAHHKGLSQHLKGWGIDLSVAVESNRFIALDAERTLAKFMVNGWPDQGRFFGIIEPVLLRAKAASQGDGASVAAFGEMVALLWADGKCEAAICLEQLWNELALRHAFTLRCAYPLSSFGSEESELFDRVCTEHQAVLPTESYTSLGTEDDRLRMVSSLQQKSQNLKSAVEAREREIARRTLAEEKLRRTEEFAKKVVENSIDCIKVLDLDGRLEYMSPPGQRALEIEDFNDFLGRRWVDFWKEEDRSRAEAALSAARIGGLGSFQGDCSTVRGVPKSWDVKITPVLDADGNIERLIAVSRDITELKQAQTAVLQAEKLAAAGRLAATIAHEINNPLEAVTNFIFLAKTSEGVPEEVCKQLEIADRELSRVAQIAQQTLGFYRDNSTRKWVSVSELLRDVITLYESRLRSKQIQTEIATDEGLKIYIKQGELRQVLANLMANAIDASSEGGKIWVRARSTKNWTNGLEPGLRITLADNGIGMAPEIQHRIFAPFFTTKPNVGTGIGLWVTKSLIEDQDGYMRFRSRQGQKPGTVMSFFLPLTRSETPGRLAVN